MLKQLNIKNKFRSEKNLSRERKKDLLQRDENQIQVKLFIDKSRYKKQMELSACKALKENDFKIIILLPTKQNDIF